MFEQLLGRHQQPEGAVRDALVQVELHAVAHERDGMRELLVAARERVALAPPVVYEQRDRGSVFRRIDQQIDVGDLPP